MTVCGLIATALPFAHIAMKRKKRMNRFLQLLPDALDLMSRGLSAGHAFTEALQMVSTEMPEPIATEFRKTYDEQNLGLSLKLALENLAQRMPLLDLRVKRAATFPSYWKRWRTQSANVSAFLKT
jgi:tight adherence protein B